MYVIEKITPDPKIPIGKVQARFNKNGFTKNEETKEEILINIIEGIITGFDIIFNKGQIINDKLKIEICEIINFDI